MLTDIGGILYEESSVCSGTGNYNSFLRLQAEGDEDGVNTDDNNVGDNKGGIWTHSILISSLVQVEEERHAASLRSRSAVRGSGR